MQANLEYKDGKVWYIQPNDGKRRDYSSLNKRNESRMFVNGKYVPKSHKLYKPGKYATFEEAWSHKELDQVTDGQVYVIRNPAWPEWVKIGMAVDATDRLRSLNTASPFRDFSVAHTINVKDKRQTERSAHRLLSMLTEERHGEWFKMPAEQAIEVLEQLKPLATD